MYNFEQIGFIPRSIIRTIKRFSKQISLKTDLFVIYEFRVSRYIAIASIQCFFFLILCPWLFQFFVKFLFFNTFLKYKTISTDIFINFNQQERAFSQMQTFSQKIYFETLLESLEMIQENSSLEKTISFFEETEKKSKNLIDTQWGAQAPLLRKQQASFSNHLKISTRFRLPNKPNESVSIDLKTINDRNGISANLTNKDRIQKIYQNYFLKCAHFYNKQSLSIIINWILDLATLLFFFVLLISSTPQILILKTFCTESLLSLSETTKCFFLIFILDLLVGFHSSKSWEIFLQFFIEHFGFQIHQNFIAFFISTFPVLLDTIFKYWIFRYLNKISPSTVATYQAMIE